MNLYGFVGNNAISLIDAFGAYLLNPDLTNGPTMGELANLYFSMARIKERMEVLIGQCDAFLVCLHENSPGERGAIEELINLKIVFRSIIAAINSGRELEVEQHNQGLGQEMEIDTYELGFDPILQLNTNPGRDWRTLSGKALDIPLLHEISHEAADTEHVGSPHQNADIIDDFIEQDICQHLNIKSLLYTVNWECCCKP